MPIDSQRLVDPALLPLLDFFPRLELSADILPVIRAMGPPMAEDGMAIDAQVAKDARRDSLAALQRSLHRQPLGNP